MHTGEGSGKEDEGSSCESGISRRYLLSTGLVFLSSSSIIQNEVTEARFANSKSAGGSIQIDRQPTLNYQIIENHVHSSSNIQYDIYYQVEWVKGFEAINLYVDNVNDNEFTPNADATFTDSSEDRDGSFSTEEFWGHDGDTFEFIFDILSSEGDGFQVIETDHAGDGGGKSEGDFSNVNSPVLESIEVIDNGGPSSANYEVIYYISNTSDFDGDVRVDFVGPWDPASGYETGPGVSGSSVTFHRDGVPEVEYEITVTVRSQGGAPHDQVSISDVSDGDDTEWPESQG